MSYFMKTAESCSVSTAINMSMLSEYVRKKKNVTCVQHSVMMTEYVAFKMYQWDTDVSTATEIIQCESWNTTRKKNTLRKSD